MTEDPEKTTYPGANPSGQGPDNAPEAAPRPENAGPAARPFVAAPPSALSPLRLVESLGMGMRNLGRHKLRSLLTTLGMVFGIGAVVSMMSVTAGASEELLSRIRKLGITNIIVASERPPEQTRAQTQDRGWIKEYGLRERDVRVIKESVPGVDRIVRGQRILSKVRLLANQASPEITGVEPAYFGVMNLKISKGRPLTDLDEAGLSCVAVVGPALFPALGGAGDPVGTDINIGDLSFRVCGVLGGPSAGAEAQQVLIPYGTALKRFGTMQVKYGSGSMEAGSVEVGKVVISCSDRESVMPAAAAVEHVMKRSHPEEDYTITVPLRLLEQAEQTQRIFSVVMVLIAGISLVVGGIGIANIMFAGVMERTREIGIRRALGARKSDVMIQFLSETVLIAVMGGVIGCGLGVGGSLALSKFTGWPMNLDPLSFAIALAISAAVGIASGMAPARRAARLDPVAAFRHE